MFDRHQTFQVILGKTVNHRRNRHTVLTQKVKSIIEGLCLAFLIKITSLFHGFGLERDSLFIQSKVGLSGRDIHLVFVSHFLGLQNHLVGVLRKAGNISQLEIGLIGLQFFGKHFLGQSHGLVFKFIQPARTPGAGRRGSRIQRIGAQTDFPRIAPAVSILVNAGPGPVRIRVIIFVDGICSKVFLKAVAEPVQVRIRGRRVSARHIGGVIPVGPHLFFARITDPVRIRVLKKSGIIIRVKRVRALPKFAFVAFTVLIRVRHGLGRVRRVLGMRSGHIDLIAVAIAVYVEIRRGPRHIGGIKRIGSLFHFPGVAVAVQVVINLVRGIVIRVLRICALRKFIRIAHPVHVGVHNGNPGVVVKIQRISSQTQFQIVIVAIAVMVHKIAE